MENAVVNSAAGIANAMTNQAAGMANNAAVNVVTQFTESMSNYTLSYAVTLAAVGTISMAFLELLKALCLVRWIYHRHRIKGWMIDSKILDELYEAAAGGRKNANILFDQPTEKMMGQIQAAANIALDYPDRYNTLYNFLTASGKSVEKNANGTTQKDDQTVWRNFIVNPSKELLANDTLAREATQARARLGNLVARRLDAFQTNTEYYWARLNQVSAFVIASGIILSALWNQPGSDWKHKFITAFMGGMLAPFAKDIVTALTGLKPKS